VADSELRICVPMPDVINGQFDKGLKPLLGTGGKGSQMDLTVEIKQITISAPRHCLHNVRPDRS
jgi:hypothetical protein